MKEWRWRACRSSPRGSEIIADSGESYKSRYGATRAVTDFTEALARPSNVEVIGGSVTREKREKAATRIPAVMINGSSETATDVHIPV